MRAAKKTEILAGTRGGIGSENRAGGGRRLRLAALAVLVLLACCMAAAASAEKAVTLDDFLPYEKGKTTIRWEVHESSTTRYVVTYKVIDNGTAVQSTLEAGRTFSNSVETAGIIPGKCYEIAVKDTLGNVLDQKAYRMDEAETFEDGKLKNTSIKIYVKPSMMESGKDPKNINTLKASEISQGFGLTGNYYGVRYTMAMPQTVKERTVFVTLAFESPDGYVYVDKATEITFEKLNKGKETVYWKIAGTNFFTNLLQENGTAPSGKYLVHLYWDGKWINTSNFTVK